MKHLALAALAVLACSAITVSAQAAPISGVGKLAAASPASSTVDHVSVVPSSLLSPGVLASLSPPLLVVIKNGRRSWALPLRKKESAGAPRRTGAVSFNVHGDALVEGAVAADHKDLLSVDWSTRYKHEFDHAAQGRSMNSASLLLQVDQQIDDLQGRIDIQNQRITQMELEVRDARSARDLLNELELSLRETIARREQIIRELDHHPRSGSKRRRS